MHLQMTIKSNNSIPVAYSSIMYVKLAKDDEKRTAYNNDDFIFYHTTMKHCLDKATPYTTIVFKTLTVQLVIVLKSNKGNQLQIIIYTL